MSVILAIETSCDETAVALVKDGYEILSNVVHSQIKTHQSFGGVVPETASRMHVENIAWVIINALEAAQMNMDDVDAIAVTQGPGLIGSLHVGVVAAKTLAWMYEKPLIPVHHIYGHIMANNIDSRLNFPLLALVVSGGHTELVYMKDSTSFELIGQTTDDAIGEAFDKVGRLMDLPYPGGVAIDKLAQSGEASYTLSVPKAEGEYNFSFSGLKSSVMQLVAREKKAGRAIQEADLAASFQKTAVKQVIDVSEQMLDKLMVKDFVIAGGVAANSFLRSEVDRLQNNYPHIQFKYPQMKYCTDNAAMIGAAAYSLYQANKFADLSLGANPSLKLKAH